MELLPHIVADAVDGNWLRMPTDMTAFLGVSIDSREELAGKLFFAIRGETHDGHDFAGAAARAGARALLVDRAIPMDTLPRQVGVLLVKNTRAALAQLAAHYRQTFSQTLVVAVTGSAGKTTTRQLIHSTLRHSMPGIASPKSFNNDIGVPLTLLAVQPSHRYVVVEVGINAIGEMKPLADIVRPDVVVITNVGESHLEGLGDVHTVAREKLELARTLRPKGVAFLHADSSALRDGLMKSDFAIPEVIWFGEAAHSDVRLVWRQQTSGHRQTLSLADGSSFPLSLAGRHNAVNALAAIAIARRLGVSDDRIAHGLEHADSMPMRLQLESLGALTILNDAYNANPQSMLAGIDTFIECTPSATRRVFVLGDMLELGDTGPMLHERLGRELAHRITSDRTLVVAVGPLMSGSMIPSLLGAQSQVKTHVCSSMSDATARTIASMLQSGDAILIKGSRSMQLERLLEVIRCESSTAACADRPVSTRTGLPIAAGHPNR